MNKIKAAIIEDEIPAGRLLHKMLSGLRPDWDIVVLPGSIEGSVKWFQEHPHPDIIFLDIQLTDGISFAFIEQAQPESMIIFTTAYDEYAIRAFTVNSIDYLLKPINRERLAEAIEKFERLTARYGNTTLSPGDQNGACEEMKSWVYAGGKVWRGLVSRREAESALCNGSL